MGLQVTPEELEEAKALHEKRLEEEAEQFGEVFAIFGVQWWVKKQAKIFWKEQTHPVEVFFF